ncbi:lipocalin family protein [Streptomyces griseorubiginosus]|uniref:lipocalin family protein n=1 Tax=Streptomyces griseorubiginosus TaxID=67304 RepID=UPI00114041C7|nr:lipocalin family protein [Streptomyces griseorubiginosus]
MKTTTRTRLAVAIAGATATALLGGAAVLPTAQAAEQDKGRRTPLVVNEGIPTTVDPAADLAAHTLTSDPADSESIFATSWVKGGGRDFGITLSTATFPNTGQHVISVGVTDVTTGWFKGYQVPVATKDLYWAKTGVDIKTPDITWKGTAQNMTVKASTPWGSLDVQLQAKGPALKAAGTGSFPLYGKTNYEYALPSMRTTGTLSVQNKDYKVSGETWLDRQWGPVDITDTSMRWTWMPVRLPNGDKLLVWDSVNSKGENAWATVMHPDGSYNLAAVKPLAEGAHRIWTSPTSGNAYPTRWSIDIPALKTHLSVRVTGTDAQEFIGDRSARYDGTAAYSGTYEGKKVSGVTYAEMVGHWRAS